MNVQCLVLRYGRIERRACFVAVDAMPPEAFLSESEEAQIGQFQFAKKRESFRLGRLAAKRALGALLGESDLRRIGIHSGANGEPLVQHPSARSAAVTVSHSHGLAVAVAFPAECPMGVDLETASAVHAGMIIGELAASAPEQAWLASAGVDEATACCVLWTAREALGKALKTGLKGPLGTLALADIRAVTAASWVGHYLEFPQYQCLLQARGSRVLSLTLPDTAELDAWPRLD